MLSVIIKKEIENKFGKEIRYPTDCEALAAAVLSETGQSISVTTLKRMYGFTQGKHEPRLYTLDVLAKYLDCANWDVFCEKFARIDNSEFFNADILEVATLKNNTVIEVKYDPQRSLRLKYKGDFFFIVVESENSKILKGDQLKMQVLVRHFPLIISAVIRDGKELGRFIAGKVSGLTEIRILNK